MNYLHSLGATFRGALIKAAIGAVLAMGTLGLSPQSGAAETVANSHREFVTTRGYKFYVDGAEFRVAGVNNHYLPWGSREEVIRVLDDAVAMNANVVRTFIEPIIGSLDNSSPTIWDWKSRNDSSNLGVNGAYMAYWDPTKRAMDINYGPDGLEKIDFLIAEASKRKLRLIVAFLDFWAYTGGAPQMSAWHGGGRDNHFFASNAETAADYKQLVRAVVKRVNSITGTAYEDDPTIFAWELMNEPDIEPNSLFFSWVGEMSSYVKSLDPDHLLASGSDGVRTRLNEMALRDIDFGTWHGYPAYAGVPPEKFGSRIASNCDLARVYDKPVLLEEFGVARSNPAQSEIYKGWLSQMEADENCAGWLVWRLVARQNNNRYPADEHDQFDIHNDGGAAWSVLKAAAARVTGRAPGIDGVANKQFEENSHD